MAAAGILFRPSSPGPDGSNEHVPVLLLGHPALGVPDMDRPLPPLVRTSRVATRPTDEACRF